LSRPELITHPLHSKNPPQTSAHRDFAQEQTMNIADKVAEAVISRGDLAHLALFVWASGASALLAMTLRDLFAANRRFDEFVRELSLFNRRHTGDPS
jgi:ABC-type proline/glycine betaine transport system permease subunit